MKNFWKSIFYGRRQLLEQAVRSAEAANDLHGAVEARRALTKLEPRSVDSWIALARALQKTGEPREAMSAYCEAFKHGGPPEEIHLQLGLLHYDLCEHERAIEHLEKALAMAPENANALCMLGVVMSELGHFDRAAELLQRALARQRDFSHAHFNLGLVQFEQSKLGGALQSFAQCSALICGKPWRGDRVAALGQEPQPQFEHDKMRVSELKLRHDCEQLGYLLELGSLPPAYGRVLEDYQSLLEELHGKANVGMIVPFDAKRHPLVARTYKRPVHIAEEVPLRGPLINPDLDFRDIEDRYFAAKPNVMTVDRLLTPGALQALCRFCLESTIWNHIKSGFLGAYFQDGFCSELLLRLAWEMRERLPRVIRGLPLQTMWGYKYDSTCPGIGIHADGAAVNVNFWITDDDANLDPDSGGLLVHLHEAPKDWGFTKINSNPEAVVEYLESLGSIPVRVPYRTNRAVIFDSDLYHASDRMRFRDGYLNRRINITLLYGARSM